MHVITRKCLLFLMISIIAAWSAHCSDNNTDADSDSDVDSDADSDSDTDIDGDSDVDGDADVDGDSDGDADSDGDPDGGPDGDTGHPEGYYFCSGDFCDGLDGHEAGRLYHNGEEIVLHGVNWFGIGIQDCDPHGLWTIGYRELLEEIVDRGFNALRLVYGGRAVRESIGITCTDFSVGSNSELKGLDCYEMIERVVEVCAELGIYVLLDNHDNGIVEGHWLADGFTAEDYIADLVQAARDFAHHDHVIGMDLINEPHLANWGQGGDDDFRDFADAAGAAVLAEAPHWLIFVEGTLYTGDKDIDSGDPRPGTANWGEYLAGASRYPLSLPAHRLVYSPHTYPFGYFDDDTQREVREYRWGYLAGDYALIPGEFATWRDDDPTTEAELQNWFSTLVDYLIEKEVPGFFYWSINGNDQIGLLDEDWSSTRWPFIADELDRLRAGIDR